MLFEAFESIQSRSLIDLRPMHLSRDLHCEALTALLNSQAGPVSAIPDIFHQDLVNVRTKQSREIKPYAVASCKNTVRPWLINRV